MLKVFFSLLALRLK